VTLCYPVMVILLHPDPYALHWRRIEGRRKAMLASFHSLVLHDSNLLLRPHSPIPYIITARPAIDTLRL
jgi:hypothetical protein